ncbi:MAG TPA: 3-hydroxyanthranilate 3,4-dioxygenase [Gammaproteobacteria bacterium]|nr:3-hydroxyanthranilate 3,4-dioxygenase [Gammaproteobacteria bacterium]
MSLMMPFNLLDWIERHRAELRPPVCNKQLYEGEEFIVQIVGGPNSRTDYHYDEGPELFYQIQGDMRLRTVQDGELVDVPIRQGEIFLLPPRVPHSPQRYADTVGLVVERRRAPEELDGFMWFCERCGEKLHEEFLQVADIVTDLPPVFARFYGSESARSCKRCGWVMPRE